MKNRNYLLFYIFIIFLLLACGGGENGVESNPEPEVNLPPANFSLLEVANNEINVTLNPELKWETARDPNSDNVTYDVLLDDNSQNPSTIIASNLQTTNLLLDVSLQFNTSYSWKVIARDSKGATANSEIFSFNTRDLKIVLATNSGSFSTRTEHGFVKFKNKMWIVGGYHASNGGVNGGLLNDVWSSSDGINWREEVANNLPNSFPSRTDHSVTVFKDKIWIIGGGGINSILNDIWSSIDGINWVQETDDATFSKRSGHTCVVFNNKIWIIAGSNQNGQLLDDVWSSSDGTNWILEADNTPFLSRFDHTSVVFNDKIWIIGGYSTDRSNDVWSSVDGVNWIAQTVNAGFSKRRGHSSAVYKDKMWVIGGELLNDIWSSSDGINWKKEIQNASFPGRGNQATTLFDNKIWIAGGWMGSLLNDVWYLE